MGDVRNVLTILVGKPEGKTPLGRPACCTLEDNVEINLKEIEWGV
jgi:hypothetical protein